MFYTVTTARIIFTGGKQVWTYSVLDENKFGLSQSRVIESMRWVPICSSGTQCLPYSAASLG